MHEGAKVYRFISVLQERGAPMTRERNLDAATSPLRSVYGWGGGKKKKIRKGGKKKEKKRVDKEKSGEASESSRARVGRIWTLVTTKAINIDDGKSE